MILVNVRRKADRIESIEVSGHAEYDESGKDLVCAAVSSIVIGLCNALDIMKVDCQFHIGDNQIGIQMCNGSEKSDIILETGLIQLRTVEEQFSDYMTIKTLEV